MRYSSVSSALRLFVFVLMFALQILMLSHAFSQLKAKSKTWWSLHRTKALEAIPLMLEEMSEEDKLEEMSAEDKLDRRRMTTP